MDLKRIFALYYSATGVTDKVVHTFAETLGEALHLPVVCKSFTKPAERMEDYEFEAGDLVIVGTATYAGRIPNKIAPDFKARLHGNGALAIALATFGNRAYDNVLAELCALLEGNGFHTVAAGAFASRHAFTDALGEGRPDWDDLRQLRDFGKQAAVKIQELDAPPPPVAVSGDPEAPYYIPKGEDGQPVKFLKAKPQTNLSKCSQCGVCARLCPMGAINPENVAEVPGTCIKCHSCVRKCTRHAKYFDDPVLLSHVVMLENSFVEPKENAIFL